MKFASIRLSSGNNAYVGVQTLYNVHMTSCEIVYVKPANGWKWRLLPVENRQEAVASDETYALFYECVIAARAKGYTLNVRCL